MCRHSSSQNTETRVCRRGPTDPCMRRISARRPGEVAGPQAGSAAATAHAQPSLSPSPPPEHASGCGPTPRRHVVTRGDSPGSPGELSRVRVRGSTPSAQQPFTRGSHSRASPDCAGAPGDAKALAAQARQLRPTLMRRRPHARQTAGARGASMPAQGRRAMRRGRAVRCWRRSGRWLRRRPPVTRARGRAAA